MRRVLWARAAERDLEAAIHYIADDSPAAALKVAVAITDTAGKLGHTPTGRPGRAAGTFEKIVRGLPYILVYRLIDDPQGGVVRITRLMHAARRWPEAF